MHGSCLYFVFKFSFVIYPRFTANDILTLSNISYTKCRFSLDFFFFSFFCQVTKIRFLKNIIHNLQCIFYSRLTLDNWTLICRDLHKSLVELPALLTLRYSLNTTGVLSQIVKGKFTFRYKQEKGTS